MSASEPEARENTADRVRTAWVVLPAYNEADNLPSLLAAVDEVATSAAMHERGFAVRAIVVDDGSADATAGIADRWPGPCHPLLRRHHENRGLGRAIETGLRAAIDAAGAGDVVVTMDADGSHRPAQIPAMIDEVARGADLVIASRYRAGGAIRGVPWHRQALSLGARALLTALHPIPGVRDYTCGYRVYTAALLRAAASSYGDAWIESQGFAVMTELLLKLRPLRPRAAEIAIDLRYDLKIGASKMVAGRTIRQYARLLLSARRARRHRSSPIG